MPDYLLGNAAKAYFSTTALTSTNTATNTALAAVITAATLAENIMDLTLEVESEFVDATTRAEAGNGWRSEIPVLKNGRITFDARWKPGDTFFEELKDAWLTNTTITFAALDQARTVTGAQGLVANFSVSFSKTEPLMDIQKVSVTLSVASYPVWYVKAA
jgi:hypothetical protein